MWANYVEKEVKVVQEEEVVAERKTNYQAVVVTEVTPELHFFVQKVDQGPALEQLMLQLRQELNTNPPLAGSYTPKKGNRLLAISLVLFIILTLHVSFQVICVLLSFLTENGIVHALRKWPLIRYSFTVALFLFLRLLLTLLCS